jgi:DNA-binding PadR family transcriptional regulator
MHMAGSAMPTHRTDPRSLLPLTPLVFQVLLALADEPRHGYGVILEVDRRTDGLIRLRTGTLYILLQRLLDEGLIQSSAPPENPGGVQRAPSTRSDPRRRYYRLTDLGQAVLGAEARRLELAVGEARRKHVLGRPGRA